MEGAKRESIAPGTSGALKDGSDIPAAGTPALPETAVLPMTAASACAPGAAAISAAASEMHRNL